MWMNQKLLFLFSFLSLLPNVVLSAKWKEEAGLNDAVNNHAFVSAYTCRLAVCGTHSFVILLQPTTIRRGKGGGGEEVELRSA